VSAEVLAEKLKFQLQSANRDVDTAVDADNNEDLPLLVDVRDAIESDLKVVTDYIEVSKRLKLY